MAYDASADLMVQSASTFIKVCRTRRSFALRGEGIGADE
jgi:hypothetical protein